MDRARKVTSVTVCGASHGEDAGEDSLKRSAELVSCMIYKDLLKQVDIRSRSAEHDCTLSMDLVEESRLQGLGAFLYVEKAEEGKIFYLRYRPPSSRPLKKRRIPSQSLV